MFKVNKITFELGQKQYKSMSGKDQFKARAKHDFQKWYEAKTGHTIPIDNSLVEQYLGFMDRVKSIIRSHIKFKI